MAECYRRNDVVNRVHYMTRHRPRFAVSRHGGRPPQEGEGCKTSQGTGLFTTLPDGQ
jgi:hypothetical protein